jgi:hypothetical protein
MIMTLAAQMAAWFAAVMICVIAVSDYRIRR